MNLSFIGLGIMGKPMAGRLLEAGNDLYVYDKNALSSIKELESKGAIPCKNPKDAAEKAKVVFIMVPDTPDVEEVLFGDDGVEKGIKPGSVVVDMSTISPVATRNFAERLRLKGVEMLDAPVSGGEIGAKNGTLSIMVGGKEEVFQHIRPYLEILGKSIIHIGKNGDGQVCKMANQVVVALTMLGVAEALVLAEKAGADPAKVREALLGGFAQSKILEVHGERMLKGMFIPGFRTVLHRKDIKIALNTAQELCVSIPGTALVHEIFNALIAHGGADLDHSSIIKVIEALAKKENF
ncbi:MAG: 2-hydroxy-3-oxopropionate reductase [Syntrophorhabdaceae bacterium]|nr:2-hydroxy-3-oxopropionate reductase [Syntrophorhabdaceae bacterium]